MDEYTISLFFLYKLNDLSKMEDEDLDLTWVNQHKDEEILYKDFYKEKVTSIKLTFIHVNLENTVTHIGNDIFFLETSGLINKDYLISLIKTHKTYKNTLYNFNSLYKFNIDINSEEINNYIADNDVDYSSRFFSQEKYLNNIYFKDTINIFQDLNTLFFVFYEKCNRINNKSKKCIIKKTATRNATRKSLRN
jgi:hypothetical protein